MKYIFDFDDVLLFTSRRREEYLYPLLEKRGKTRKELEDYYEKNMKNLFSMKNFLANLSLPKELYEEVMSGIENFANKELIEIVKKLGKSSCYLVTYGDTEFQLDKVNRLGIVPLFSEIFVVSGSKKEIIEKICAKHKDEKVIFIDDKAYHFEDLDFKKYPNLKTILYTEHNI